MEEQFSQIEALLRRVGLFLEDGEWAQADAYCERILDMDPENARAYTGKLFAKFQVNNTQQFLQVAAQKLQEVMDDPNTKKILRFGTEQEKAMFQHILSGVEQERRRQRENALNNSCAAVQQGHFDIALHNFDILKEQFPDNHRVWFWRMMARLQCRNLFALVDKGYPINKDPDFLKAVACADAFQAQSYRDTAKQVLFSTHIKCQMCLATRTGVKENWANWMDLYLNNCEPDDPYGEIYRALRKIPLKDWSDTLIAGALIHIQNIYEKEIAAGRLKGLGDELFSGEISNVLQAPQMYLSLHVFIMDRLEQIKEQAPTQEPKSSLIPGWDDLHGGTVKLKALRETAVAPTLYRDYVGEIIYKRYRQTAAERLSKYVTYLPTKVVTEVSSASEHTVNAIRRWCEPDCLFSKASGMPMLPIPEGAIAKGEPREVWQRYAHMAQLVATADNMIYCAEQILKMAPQEFYKLRDLQDKLLDKIAGYHKGVSLENYLKTMDKLYPNDYRTHYVHLRQITKEFEKPKTFQSGYNTLSNRLAQLKRKDVEGAQKLKEQYNKLQQEILEYMRPYAEAEKAHGDPICFGCMGGVIPQKDFHMRNEWLTWWQPLKEENDQILQKISEDLKKIAEKSQKGFSLFGR